VLLGDAWLEDGWVLLGDVELAGGPFEDEFLLELSLVLMILIGVVAG
jgi:hypothetical protein